MKMLDLSRDKQFEQLCWEAREVEIMMSAQSSGMPFLQNERVIHALEQESTQNPSTPSGRFQTLTPTRQDRFSSNNYEPNRRRNQTPGPQQRFRQNFDNRNQQSQYRNQRPPNDRRWNNRPVCNYCKKVGHVANACRTRLADFQNNQRPQSFNQRAKSDRWSTTPFASGANAVHQDQTLSLLHEIARTMNKLTVNADQPGRRDDVNTIATSTEQCHVKKVHIKDKSATSKSEPLQVSSWEKTTLGPKIHPFIFIVSMFCICGPVFSNTAMIPQGPMLCQTETQPTLWKLPEIPECPIPKVTVGHVPISQIRELYIPNAIEHNTKAWACRKIIKRARKFTSLSGVPITEALSSVMLDVSVDECKQMIEHRSCIFGILTEVDGLRGTSNPIDLTPRFWFIGSFSWYEVNSKNCFAFETVVSSHFGESNIKSPIGTQPNCHYGNGNCTLGDKTMLLWTPEKSTNCRYIFVAKYKGHYVNNSWLSEDAEYGLHFKQPTPKVSDCGLKLQLSEQGFATRVLSNSNTRSKRSHSREGLGLTTSIELNARLTYLDNEWADAIMYAFRQSFKASCDFMVTTRRWAAAAYLVDPISLARMLFNNTKLYAVRSGSSILKIWPCISIKNGEYRFKPTQIDDLCFERLPIEFKTQAKNELAFLDPSTMIIHADSKKASCSTHRKIIIQLNDKVFEVDQVSGKTETLEVQIFNSELRLKQISEIERHSFHQRALINLTDLNTHAFVSGMIKASAITYKIIADELKSKVIGDYRLTWLTLLTILVALLILDFTLRYAPVLLECYVGNGRLARIIFGRRKPKQDIEETYQVNDFPLSDVVQTHEILETRGNPTNWPPSVSNFPPSFASSDPQNSRPMGRLQTLRKSLKSRKRSTSSPSNAQGRIAGTSAATSIMVLAACISLLPQTEAVDHQDEMRTSLLDWWVALIPAFCAYLVLFVALYCLKYLLHNRKEVKASYLTWNEVVSRSQYTSSIYGNCACFC
ncbi:hypothetical protein niasHT_018426 [Heterodera trifolii]|uniref:Uncharacterized protein n=1 Tax=Heterodera trifolii TaxID=157864 RepID=A0ABD2KWC2_9BILA